MSRKKRRNLPELRAEVERLKSEQIHHAYCLERGWKTLCKRFRAFLNHKSGPPPDDPGERLRWGERRAEFAREFIRQEDIPKYKGNALIEHVGVTKTRGYRPCFKCMDRRR